MSARFPLIVCSFVRWTAIWFRLFSSKNRAIKEVDEFRGFFVNQPNNYAKANAIPI